MECHRRFGIDEERLNEVSGALTQDQLLSMMTLVVTDGEDPADVAADWVSANLD